MNFDLILQESIPQTPKLQTPKLETPKLQTPKSSKPASSRSSSELSTYDDEPNNLTSVNYRYWSFDKKKYSAINDRHDDIFAVCKEGNNDWQPDRTVLQSNLQLFVEQTNSFWLNFLLVNDKTINYPNDEAIALIQKVNDYYLDNWNSARHKLPANMNNLLTKVKKISNFPIDDNTLLTEEHADICYKLLNKKTKLEKPILDKISTSFENAQIKLAKIIQAPANANNYLKSYAKEFFDKHSDYIKINHETYEKIEIFCIDETVFNRDHNVVRAQFDQFNTAVIKQSEELDKEELLKDLKKLVDSVNAKVKEVTTFVKNTFDEIKKEMGWQTVETRKVDEKHLGGAIGGALKKVASTLFRK